LSEILGNPLFVPLLVAVLTIVTTAYFNYWLKKWQYRREYIISNVEKTYIPLLEELDDLLGVFNQFLEDPYNPNWKLEKMENIKKSGLFEFIKSHDRKLGDKLTFFYESIHLRFVELSKLQQTTYKNVKEMWASHISSLLSDAKAKQHSDAFVSNLFSDGLYVMLLKNELDKASGIWFDRAYQITEQFNLYANYVQVEKDRIQVSRNAKISTFAPSPEELEKLWKMSQPDIQKLLVYYKQTKEMLEKEVVNGLIPMMQKYVTDPLAR
jgi:hypothetical protein